MIATAASIADLTLTITQEVHINASLEVAFEALLEQLGRSTQGMMAYPFR